MCRCPALVAIVLLPFLIVGGIAVTARDDGPRPKGTGNLRPDGKETKDDAAGAERAFEIAPGVSMVFCWVPPGTATLGSPAVEAHRSEGETEHEFTTPGFWLGKYEVTQQEWVAITGENPSYFRADGRGSERLGGIKDTSRYPVEGVSWDDCQAFLKKLNARAG